MTEQELKAKTAPMSDITKLPDGSAFFTATIMSREEAMKLPPEKRPICFRISSEMYVAVFEAIGAASMCWKPRPGSEVFASEEASKVAVDLCFKVAKEIENLKAKLEAVEKERDEAKACCAEMREVLVDAQWRGYLGNELDLDYFSCPFCKCYDKDSDKVPHTLNCRLSHALSSDCGKDFRRISDFKPLVEALKYCLEESVYTQESCGANIAKAAQDALTLARKLGIE